MLAWLNWPSVKIKILASSFEKVRMDRWIRVQCEAGEQQEMWLGLLCKMRQHIFMYHNHKQDLHIDGMNEHLGSAISVPNLLTVKGYRSERSEKVPKNNVSPWIIDARGVKHYPRTMYLWPALSAHSDKASPSPGRPPPTFLMPRIFCRLGSTFVCSSIFLFRPSSVSDPANFASYSTPACLYRKLCSAMISNLLTKR